MYQHGSTCYESSATVNSLIAASNVGSVVRIGDQTYVLAVSGVTDTSITYEYFPALAGGSSVIQTVAMAPPACALLTAADAVEVGWLIGGVWIAVYAVKFLANYFQSEIDGIKNDA